MGYPHDSGNLQMAGAKAWQVLLKLPAGKKERLDCLESGFWTLLNDFAHDLQVMLSY